MIVAFFADDASASHAALLTARALATVDRPATLVQFTYPGAAALGAAPELSPIHVVRVGTGADLVADLSRAVDQVAKRDGDLILAAPLHLIASPLLASCRHLPVLPCGATFMGTVATRKVVRERTHAPQTGTDVPHWLLACGRRSLQEAVADIPNGQAVLTTPERMRLLPVVMPLLSRADVAALMTETPPPSVLRKGVLLAAALEAAAADPSTECLDSAGLAHMLDPGPGLADRHLSEKLSALADMFDALPDSQRSASIPTAASRRPETGRRRLPARPAPGHMGRVIRSARRTAAARDLHQRTPPLSLAKARSSLRRP